MQVYIPFLLSLFLIKNYQSFNFEDSIPFKSILWIICVATTILVPIGGFLLLLDAQHKLTPQGRVNELNQKQMKKKYGTFWLNTDTTRISALTYQLIFFTRRFILTTLIAFVDDMSIQLLTLSLTSLFLISFHTAVKPMTTEGNRRIEIYNEVIIYVSISVYYLLTPQTPITQDPFVRWILGFVLIGLTYLCMAINGIIILGVIMRRFKLFLLGRKRDKLVGKIKKQIVINAIRDSEH